MGVTKKLRKWKIFITPANNRTARPGIGGRNTTNFPIAGYLLRTIFGIMVAVCFEHCIISVVNKDKEV
jgi:hypothetical protein